MELTASLSEQIVAVAYQYLGWEYRSREFDCVEFVRRVYRDVGIVLPIFSGRMFPPTDFHLSDEAFALMPIGHSVFLRRWATTSTRCWTHLAIIVSVGELIHCSRHFGCKVVITPKLDLMQVYALAPTPPQ